jgi:RHS repeat-associated protein
MAARVSRPDHKIEVMHTTDQQASWSQTCFAPMTDCVSTQPRPRNPQASYYRARYYDSNAGRFLTEDALRYEPTSFYSYVGNDPVFWNDPLGLYKCAPGANCDFIPELDAALKCFEKCYNKPLTITCGADSHPPADPHMWGNSADIGQNTNPGLTRPIAENCFKQCFPQGIMGSYAQQEYNANNNGTHFHFQYFPASGDLSGFRPGIAPHGPRKKP